jgi:hypothetical protein
MFPSLHPMPRQPMLGPDIFLHHHLPQLTGHFRLWQQTILRRLQWMYLLQVLVDQREFEEYCQKSA